MFVAVYVGMLCSGFSYFTLNLTKPAPKAVLPSSSSSLTGFNTASAGSTRSSSSGAAGGVHPTAADKGSDGGVQSVGRPHLANASPVAATPTQPASDAVSTPAALSPVGEAEEQSDLEPQLSGFECISFMGGVPVSVGCDNTAPSVTASTTNPVAAGRMDLQSTAEAAAAAAASTAGAIPLEAGLQEAASVRLPVTSSTSFFNMPEGWSPFATAVAGGVCSSKPCGGSVNESDTTTSRIPSIQDQCNTAGGPCSAASTGQPVLWHHQHGSMYIRSAGPCATPCLSHLCSKTRCGKCHKTHTCICPVPTMQLTCQVRRGNQVTTFNLTMHAWREESRSVSGQQVGMLLQLSVKLWCKRFHHPQSATCQFS